MKVEPPVQAGYRPVYPPRTVATAFAAAACLLGHVSQAQNAAPPVPGPQAPAAEKGLPEESRRKTEEDRKLVELAREVLDGNISSEGISGEIETVGGASVRTRGLAHISPTDLEEYRQDKQSIDRTIQILEGQIKEIEDEEHFINEERKQECARQAASMKLVIQLLQQYKKDRGDHIRYWLPQPGKAAEQKPEKKQNS